MPTLVHDYLLVMRGAERTFAEIAACFPGAPISTLLYDAEGTNGRFAGRELRTSYLQRSGTRQRGFRRMLPLFPRAAERLQLGDPGLVLSSSSAFAHGVRPPPGVPHVSYCYTPFRYAWLEQERALAEQPRLLRPALRHVLGRIRRWDLAAAHEVTAYIAISKITQDRIAEFWDREAEIVHPPVDTQRFAIGTPEDYFLVVTELVAHKRVELALEAARRAGVPIKVVGSGPDYPRLHALYGDSAEFLRRIPDDRLADLYAGARALIVANVEEFGIAAVESQAAGRPVIAARAGGATETVIDGETGVFVTPGSVDELAEAMRETDFDTFSPARISAHAAHFSAESFRARYVAEVARVTGLDLGHRLEDGEHRADVPVRVEPLARDDGGLLGHVTRAARVTE
jgi:glycosyltransferase involved in cell wall biosynthesis